MTDDHETNEAPSLPMAKAEGAFLALAAGDALGWPQEIPRNVLRRPKDRGAHIEFVEWTRRSGGRSQPYEETIHAGDYSDDTQLTLAVARSRTEHGANWWKAFTRMELPLWMLYERGGGGATKRAAKAWADGHAPWKSRRSSNSAHQYFGAGGNGVAMRVLPHALFLAGREDPSPLMHDVVLDGSATHGHPRALIGAMVYAYAAWSLARRAGTLAFGELLDALVDEACEWGRFPESDRSGSWFEAAGEATNGRYEQVWEQTKREMLDLLAKARFGLQAGALADDHAVLNDLGCFGREKGAGTRSAAAAAYLVARHAAQPAQGIIRAAFEKGADTDTLAAMVGGLMGCLAGIEWLPPPWHQVQDTEYLRNIATRVALGSNGADQQPVEPPPPPKSILSDLARERESKFELAFGGARRFQAIRLPEPRRIAKSIAVRAWRLRATDGQTLYITKVDRLPKEIPEQNVTVRADTNVQAYSTCTSANLPAESAIYAEFRRQLRSLLSQTGEMKRSEIERALGLVRSQVSNWLERAEQEGWIHCTSKRPRKVALSDDQGSLLASH